MKAPWDTLIGASETGADSSRAIPRPASQHEFPIWLMRTTVAKLRHAAALIWMGPQYNRLARFSFDMWTCSRSSMPVPQSLELCIRPHSKSRIGELWADAPAKVRSGATLAESLQDASPYLPAFYLPVVEAGEQSGRLDEAFEFLHNHCKLLAGPASAIRNIWLFPLAILMAGSLIRVALFLVAGHFSDGIATLVTELGGWIQMAIVLAVIFLTPVRVLLDEVRLRIPWLGELEREICVLRFFRVMSLVYGVDAGRVEAMIQIAAKAVTNRAAQNDFLRAAKAIESKATISDAVQRVNLLSPDERATIEVGEVSGTLEGAFDEVANQAEASMMPKLATIQPILTRIVMSMVAASIALTMLRIAMG